ncbi:MAG: hypothetical protein Q8N26_26015 [Myxococcales bacterium]|nr:hypothetical protein [Myxococcales bacterium]
MLRSVLMAVVLAGCTQEYEQAPAPLPPTGRIEPGLLACAGLGGCAPDAGACFFYQLEVTPVCTGSNSKSPCDVIECDEPARCFCFLSNPPRCTCALTTSEP